MPYRTHRTVFKRMRQNARRRERNRIIRGSVRAVLRAIRSNKSVAGAPREQGGTA